MITKHAIFEIKLEFPGLFAPEVQIPELTLKIPYWTLFSYPVLSLYPFTVVT